MSLYGLVTCGLFKFGPSPNVDLDASAATWRHQKHRVGAISKCVCVREGERQRERAIEGDTTSLADSNTARVPPATSGFRQLIQCISNNKNNTVKA